MAALEKIIELQNKGMSDADIAKNLTDQGISPQEINDALNQAKVKQAVSQEGMQSENMQPSQMNQQAPQMPQQTPPNHQQDMQQSMMPSQDPNQPSPQADQAQTPPPNQPEQQGGEQYYYPETPQAYNQEAYYPQQSSVNPETVTEIAEQVVLEKFQEFKQKTGDITSFKNQATDQINDLDLRLKRIEESIEKLQQAVIGKIGEFGESSSHIHKDLDNIHNTMSKLMNPLIDNYKELKKITKSKK
jgi:hypothetical protein